jgi:hypothetical protein
VRLRIFASFALALFLMMSAGCATSQPDAPTSIAYSGTTLSDAEKALFEKDGLRPDVSTMGLAFYYYGTELDTSGGPNGNWYMYRADAKPGSQGACGNARVTFPPAKTRTWSVNPNAKCGNKWIATILWGN